MRVAVAGPVDHAVRRLDTIALLNWTLPELARLLPELPSRLTIVSAGEPMWRGGLSAPQSLFLHAERPLISENATSTLLHEVMHMSLGLTSRDGYDWIVEGLAEYYSLQLLQRSGTISNARFAAAQADISDWAETAGNLCGPSSSGATTALAVTILDALNNEILEESAGESSLDDVARELWRLDEKTDLALLSAVAGKLIGHKPDALHIDMLPGCRTIASQNSTN
jgi:predicted metalloprotease with PDZ domain